MTLHPDVLALSGAMHELESFLREQGHTYWADKVARCAQLVDQPDAYGLKQFLGLFGGMGSLNDLALWSQDSSLTPENERLDALRSKAWKITNKLAREER